MYKQKAKLLTRSPVGLVNSEGVDVYDYGTSRCLIPTFEARYEEHPIDGELE